MEQGRWYDANYDIDLVKQRMHSYDLCFEYNQLKPSDPRKKDVLNLILNASCEHIEVLSPVTFDYGKYNIWRKCFCEYQLLFYGWRKDYNR